MESKIKHALYLKKEDKYYEDLSKNEYNAKYKSNLTCINGCKARIKFTERKNLTKFFSTWNKEGHLHDQGCPYYVEYKGKIGRKKLNQYYASIELNDDDILRRLKDKMRRLMQNHSDEEDKTAKGSNIPINIGDLTVPDYNDDGDENANYNVHHIKYEKAEFVTTDDIGCRKAIIGFIDNVQLVIDKQKEPYAYFNLATKHNTVHIVFQEAFYKHELCNGIQEFERYITAVNKLVNDNPNKVMIIAYGEIANKKKDKNGVNVLVISPDRILVNNRTFHEIMYVVD